MLPLLKPVQPRPIYAGGHVHLVPDEIATVGLREHLLHEIGKDFYACILLANGNGRLMPSTPYLSFQPDEERSNHIYRLAIAANRGAAHGGHWITALSEHDWFALWRDGDGDHQFTIKSDEPWARERRQPLEDFVQLCEAAWQTWHEQVIQRLDVRPGETFKRAQGQRAPSGRSDAAF